MELIRAVRDAHPDLWLPCLAPARGRSRALLPETFARSCLHWNSAAAGQCLLASLLLFSDSAQAFRVNADFPSAGPFLSLSVLAGPVV